VMCTPGTAVKDMGVYSRPQLSEASGTSLGLRTREVSRREDRDRNKRGKLSPPPQGL
jgi:hypothetical protein